MQSPQAGQRAIQPDDPGRCILQPEVMRILERQEKGAGGEIQLT